MAARSRFVDAVRERLAALPVVPANVAEAAITAHMARRRRVAASDATWAEIEDRRRTDGPAVLFLSSDAGLGFPEWETQREIEERLCPDPVWMPFAQRVRHWHLHRVVSTVRFALQRQRRGWSDVDTFDAGRHLARMAAGMLEHLAEHSTGWPAGDEFPEPEDWAAALRHNAAELRRWVDGAGEGELRSRWYAAASDADVPAEDSAALFEELNALEDANREAARRALRWVADHVDVLWD